MEKLNVSYVKASLNRELAILIGIGFVPFLSIDMNNIRIGLKYFETNFKNIIGDVKFENSPTGEAVSYWNKWSNTYSNYIPGDVIPLDSCLRGRVLNAFSFVEYSTTEWYEIKRDDADYFSMVLTDQEEWSFFPTIEEINEEYKYCTPHFEEIETKLLSV